MTILEQIIQTKVDVELPLHMGNIPIAEMQRRALGQRPALDFIGALKAKPGVALIAEVKRASPSKGLLCRDFDPLRLASAYASNGATAISVLTDEPYFQGRLEYLSDIRRHVPEIPLLRKDFIIHPYQVYEARAAAADALLLIAAALPDDELCELMLLTNALGMAPLVEVHNIVELRRVLPMAPRLIGVNNRNLHDFSIDLNTCINLRPFVPPEVCFVAESGIHNRADVKRLAQAGIDAMLIGEALVTAPDPGAKVKEFCDDGES